MKKLKLGILILAAVLILIQLIPVSKTNPEATGDIQGLADFKQLLHRSCYDCHSNETQWPWYSRVAPISWFIAHDVNEARKLLNFSQWEEYTPEARAHLKQEIVEHVTEGAMPLRQYVFLHPAAKLSEADIELVKQWAGAGAGQ